MWHHCYVLLYFSWDIKAWSECSSTCGKSTQTASLRCVRQVEEEVDEEVAPSDCMQDPPSTIKQCDVPDCPPHWHVKQWQQVRYL